MVFSSAFLRIIFQVLAILLICIGFISSFVLSSHRISESEAMNTPTCVPCQDRLSCGDSPLSITSNIVGLLTFVAAIFISVQFHINSIRSADQLYIGWLSSLEQLGRECQSIRTKIEQHKRRITITDSNVDEWENLNAAIEEAVHSFQQAANILDKLIKRRLDSPIWGRIMLIRKDGVIKEHIEKAEQAVAKLRTALEDIVSL